MATREDKIDAAFANGGLGSPFRYIPRPTGEGRNFMIYDWQEHRFLLWREVDAMPIETIKSEMVRTVSAS